jgi:esterase/lipase superfamily enzyme
MTREYHKSYSTALQRDMELLVFGNAGRPVLMFPTRMARFYDYENWGIIAALGDRINNGELQIFCVDSIDSESFYNHAISPADRIKRHIQYEQYILTEVIPLMHVKNSAAQIEIAGCSMGAYHAVNLSMKYPQLFNKVVGMSGRYDLTKGVGYFKDLFEGYHDENIYFNIPLQFIANLQNQNVIDAIAKLEIILAIGQTDPFLPNNVNFSNLLWSKGITNQLYVWDNYAHQARSWRQMVRLYL